MLCYLLISNCTHCIRNLPSFTCKNLTASVLPVQTWIFHALSSVKQIVCNLQLCLGAIVDRVSIKHKGHVACMTQSFFFLHFFLGGKKKFGPMVLRQLLSPVAFHALSRCVFSLSRESIFRRTCDMIISNPSPYVLEETDRIVLYLKPGCSVGHTKLSQKGDPS